MTIQDDIKEHINTLKKQLNEDNEDIWEKQHGGNHYSNFKIQPSQFINTNDLRFAEGNAIKYICRHPYKGKKEDLQKAIHYIEMIIERDYS